MDIPNNLYSNLIQAPLFFFCTAIVASVKRRIKTSDRRNDITFRYDTLRQMAVTLYCICTMISIAIIFEGNDVLNLITIMSLDMTVGTAIDIGILRTMFIGGMKIGSYGDPPCKDRAVWHTAATMTMSVTARCTSAIGAICLFPYTNKHADYLESVTINHNIVIVGLPALYCCFRTLALDQFYRFSTEYASIEILPVQSERSKQFVIESDEDDTDVRPAGPTVLRTIGTEQEQRENDTAAD